MPIKLPKGFARRKSSGNALEEVENPPQSSFRVFERPSVDRKSVSDGNLLSKRLSDGQLLYSSSEDQDNLFAPADHQQPIQRICRESDDNSPSARFDSSFPRRSTDGPVHSDTQSPHFRNLYDRPTPISGALRAAGRTFSFGGRFSKTSVPIPPPHQSTPGPSTRNRAMTTSTNSTATPPKLLDTDLSLGQIGDDFHNMFDDVGKQESGPKKPSPRDSSADTYPPSSPELTFQRDGKAARPPPINIDRSKEIEQSPYSWGSRHSEEGLLTTSPQEEPAAQFSLNQFPQERRKSLPLSHAVPATTTNHRSLERPNGVSNRGLRRSVLYPSSRESAAVEDEDAKLVMESLYSNRRSSQGLFASDPEDTDDTPLFANNKSQPESPIQTRKSIGVVMADQADLSIAAHARLAAQYERSQPASTVSTNKVMTPSQFEHYRQQQELRRSNSDASKSDDSAGSDFDEDDEAEKNREAERLRRKQEAHLSVYRQQMMKVTGHESPAPSLRPDMERASNSAPNLTVQSINAGNRSGSGKSSDGDEDEEIPLGILAAHGFPSRNRPPSRLNPSSSIPNIRASYQQPYISSSSSVAGHEPGNRTSLPVFARNLPRDPYYGAGLVNSTNRESLALGGGTSVYGGPSAATGGPQALPPGGLVGVIATEERARAMRRGSPNTQAMYEYQNAMPTAPTHPGGIPRPYTMMNMNTSSAPGPQSGISAAEQAQIQLSQQMSSMMQMQIQWMQQMMQVQGGQGPPQPLMPPPGFPPALAAQVNMRPSSMPSSGPLNHAQMNYQNEQRTLSMLDASSSPRLNTPAMSMPYASGAMRPGTPSGQTYAPSIAPSERSNVGMASRYRPVSTIPPEMEANTYSYGSKPWNDENHRSSLSTASPSSSHLNKPTIRPVSSGSKFALASRGNNGALEEDDEDEGWAEMMKKREKKRNNWKLKKETSGFGDLLNAVH
ncbi:hypothetical protein FE257_003883 [Aspergillus nanangensis]|uniref:Uncharacterized protein n=1 Tax=Aspergillus nanangensis TaxID=2582783 RepID=A0AAD4GNB7_ASPNN|nr:hypothetical protein FE257_003883 [Aspergillus nanangensis]